jgi:hypothetical protein
MTREAFIKKWLANPEKDYNEDFKTEMRDDLDKVIGGVYKYPDGKKHFTLKEFNGYICMFECGHWCTDCVFEDLIFIGKQLDFF